MRRHPLLRPIALVVALLQLGLAPAATFADAWMERAESARAGVLRVAHIEAEGTAACPRVHDQDCALCQLVAAPRAVPRGAAPLPVGAAGATVPADAPAFGRDRAVAAARLPRAPPLG